MKKGICLMCVPGEKDSDRIKLIRKAKFDGFEIGSSAMKKAKELNKIAKDNGLVISSIMNTFHWQNPLSDKDPKVRKVCADSLKKDLEIASEIGANAVLLVPGVVNENTPYEDAYKRSFEEISKLSVIAEKCRTYIAVENVWNKFLLSPIEFCKFIDDIGSPYVQAYFDVGNILLYGFPQHWIKSLGKRLKKIHMKNFNIDTRLFVFLLEGHVNWQEVMKALREIKYNDFLTAELGQFRHFPEQTIYDISCHMDRIMAT